MYERYVVVDIETTGHSVANGDRMIQIGAVVLENGEKVDTYSSYINPSRDIPPFIEDLTGISNETVANAPSFHEIIPDILTLLENASFVAHNVNFDRSFLAEQLQLEGYEFPNIPLYDTVELARMLMPSVESYKLTQLTELLGFEHEHPHRADSDAEVTSLLFLELLNKLKSLPILTLQQLIPIAKKLNSDLTPLLERNVQNKIKSGTQDELTYDCYRLLALRKTEEDIENESSKETPEETFPSFMNSLTGKIENAFSNYEVRQGQLQMMEEVNAAFQQSEHKMIEAGTGTGKTLAYLLPAAFYAQDIGQPIVISTQTIPLQEQLLSRDLPLLNKLLPFPVKVALLKGRNHYLCLRKFEQSLTTIETDSYDVLLTKAILLIWLTETEHGDVEELNLPSGGWNFWFEVRSDAATDLGRFSPWFSRCYYYRAKKRAQEAHLVITNHALLCTDLINDQRVLPTYTHAVIDEAHHFEETASDYLGARADYVSFAYLIQRLSANQGEGILDHILKINEKYDINQTVKKDQFNSIIQTVKDEIDELFRMLHSYVLQSRHKSSTDIGRIRYRYEYNENGDSWQAILECMMRVHLQTKDLLLLLTQLLDSLTEGVPVTYKEQGIIADFRGLIESFAKEEDQLYRLLLEFDPNVVYWIEIEPKGAKNATYLFSMPIDVSDLLADGFFAKKKSVVLTSATLSVNGSFDYQEQRLGLTDFAPIKTTITSPFSYEDQVRLLLPTDLPNIKDVSDDEFSIEVAVKLWRLAEASNGKILVLFTSYDMLRRVYRSMKDFNEEGLLQLIGQGITTGSRARLIKMFKESNKAMLFGTSSFWEGIDLPGEQLKTLVIVRLPFSPPDQPLLQAQYEKAKADGQNPFMTLSLPQAIIRFKQGFGRLIRTKKDSGSVFVFDRRISTTRYGKLFIRSLPNVPVDEDKFENLLEKHEEYL